jgi:hypothetical protein
MEAVWVLGVFGLVVVAVVMSEPPTAPVRILRRARRHLDEDQPEAALRILAVTEEAPWSAEMAASRATVRLLALITLHRFDEAEALLDHHPRPFLDEAEAADWADARAQVRLGRGDPEGALAVLESAEPVPAGARARIELTRLRVLAARGRDDEVVWRRLREQPPEVLKVLTRRHGAEPAATIALRLLDGSAYR